MRRGIFLGLTALFCLLPGMAEEGVQDDPAAARRAEWQRRCADRWSSNIVWNTARTAAVAWQEVGGDYNSYCVWCFRADERGCMQPVAYVAAQSDMAHLQGIEFLEDEMIVLNMADKERVLFRYAFTFNQRYGSMRYMGSDLRMVSERKPELDTQPGYETVKALAEGL